jgi:hypothetical protein
MSHTHMTAPTQFLEAKGIRFAYRRFGKETGVPLVFMQHFRDGLDHWDPAITDGLGRDRPVVLTKDGARRIVIRAARPSGHFGAHPYGRLYGAGALVTSN